MDHSILRVLGHDFGMAWARWRADMGRVSLPDGPIWRTGIHWFLAAGDRRRFPAYAAAVCLLGLGMGAQALRAGRGDSELARWFTIIALFTVGFALERIPVLGHSTALPYWAPNLDIAFVVLLALVVWPTLRPPARLTLGVFVTLVTLAQVQQGQGGVRGIAEGFVVAWILVLILRATLRGLWRLSLWRRTP